MALPPRLLTAEAAAGGDGAVEAVLSVPVPELHPLLTAEAAAGGDGAVEAVLSVPVPELRPLLTAEAAAGGDGAVEAALSGPGPEPLQAGQADDVVGAEISLSQANTLSPAAETDPWAASTPGLPSPGLVDSDSDSDSDGSSGSDISGLNWKPNAGPICWVQEQIGCGVDPREVLRVLRPGLQHIPAHINPITLWKIVIEILSEPPRREKLRHVNTLSDVTRLIRGARNVIVLTGAGVSVSCGIPDFRSRDGIYARLAVDFPDLPDPQAMFDIQYFRRDPRPFFKFAKEIYPGQFRPSPCHRFIRMLERQDKLLRNYTQNIDTLEQQAGIQNVIQCHGSFATATCQRCRLRVSAEHIRGAIFEQTIPRCPRCSADAAAAGDGASTAAAAAAADGDEDTGDSGFGASSREADDEPARASVGLPPAIMKPDIVFFGEGLSDEFHRSMEADRDRCDLLIIIGSSLKVRPVALIPSSVRPEVAQILINREPLPHLNCDVQLLGDCDVIVDHLCHLLGGPFEELVRNPPLTELDELPPRPEAPPTGQDPANEDDLEALKHCWQRKIKERLSARLPEGTYLHQPPGRYVFPGAELLVDPDSDSDDDEENAAPRAGGSASPTASGHRAGPSTAPGASDPAAEEAAAAGVADPPAETAAPAGCGPAEEETAAPEVADPTAEAAAAGASDPAADTAAAAGVSDPPAPAAGLKRPPAEAADCRKRSRALAEPAAARC